MHATHITRHILRGTHHVAHTLRAHEAITGVHIPGAKHRSHTSQQAQVAYDNPRAASVPPQSAPLRGRPRPRHLLRNATVCSPHTASKETRKKTTIRLFRKVSITQPRAACRESTSQHGRSARTHAPPRVAPPVGDCTADRLRTTAAASPSARSASAHVRTTIRKSIPT